LPATAVALGLATRRLGILGAFTGEGSLEATSLGMFVLCCGFGGTATLWFVSADAGTEFTWARVVSDTRYFWWRYVRLAFATILVLAVSGIPLMIATHEHPLVQKLVLPLVFAACAALVLFASIAIAFDDARAPEALVSAAVFVRSHWAISRYYVLTTFVLASLEIAAKWGVGLPVEMVLSAVAIVAGVLVRGAAVLCSTREMVIAERALD
jgi:hypothetical protein